ncbi:MAG TPA: type II toxin-antitoxin system VapC family toxin [Terriglobales bacterium]|nr:type II toxin-antitoxin system VapC family toxin [Terriglobales bacterium]
MRLLLDTSVLIDVLRARKGRRKLLAQLTRDGHNLTTSALNVAEVYAGMRPAEENETQMFLSILDCYPITSIESRRAGQIKREWAEKGKTLSLADTIVAATALEHECILVTDNRKDFPMQALQLFPLDQE